MIRPTQSLRVKLRGMNIIPKATKNYQTVNGFKQEYSKMSLLFGGTVKGLKITFKNQSTRTLEEEQEQL